jgi:hypothetical protein
VAIALRDQRAFAEHAAACAEQLNTSAHRVLAAKCEKLKQTAQRAELDLDGVQLPDPNYQTEQLIVSQLTSQLESCRGARERAGRCLSFLLKGCGASEGFLYVLAESGPELIARQGGRDEPADLLPMVRDHIAAELSDQDAGTAMVPEGARVPEPPPITSELKASGDERFRLVLLAHQVSGAFAITGVVAVVVKPGKRFVYPGPLAAELSRLLLDAGDAVPALAGPQ